MKNKFHNREKKEIQNYDINNKIEEVITNDHVVDFDGVDEDGTSIRVFVNKNITRFITIYCVAFSLFHIALIFIRPTNQFAIYATHWTAGMILIFTYYTTKKNNINKKFNVFDIACIVGCFLTWIYIMNDSMGLLERLTYMEYTTSDLIFGILAIVLTLESTRRSMGLGLPIVTLVLIAYALFGVYVLPGDIATKAYSLTRVVTTAFSTYGMFGLPIYMSTMYISVITIFGAYLQIMGVGDTIMYVAKAAFGRSRGGPAKVAVLSSGLFGTVSGSAVGNVIGTGVFTIPMMKKTGYESHFAGAVEAVASSGGMIMPPVMGTAAFIMAELLGISYASICIAAVVPALLYYFSLFLSVDFEAGRLNLKRMEVMETEKVSSILKKRWHHVVPLISLIVCLSLKFTISRSALISTLLLLLACFIAKEPNLTSKNIVKGLEQGAKNLMTIIGCCACAGVAISLINLTGLGIKFTLLVGKLAGTSMLLSLIFAGVATIILGMGLPTSAAYMVASSVLIGALTKLGLQPLIAHMFIFYYAALADITPPVCMAAYAAANLAGAPAMKTGFTAMRLGLCQFFIPYFIVYSPELLLIGSIGNILTAIITATLGVMFFTMSTVGWVAGGSINIISRMILFASSLLMVYPGLDTDIIGLIGVILALLMHAPIRKRLLKIKAEHV